MSETGFTDVTTKTFFEAHVAFELAQWQGVRATGRLRAEVEIFWAWAARTPLSALVAVDTAAAAAERLMLDIELPDRLGAVVAEIVNDLIQLPINRQTRVQDVIDEALFDEGVELTIELEALRTRLIRQVLASPVYTAVASDVLYQGIRDYIFANNAVLGSIPGISSLLKGSTSAVNKHLPGLEAEVEKRVRNYIETNITKTLARSEQLLLESLDAARMRAIAADIWDAIRGKSLHVADAIEADEAQQLVDFGLHAWRQLRQTEYAGQLVDAAVRAWFERNGQRPLADLFADVGVDCDVLSAEIEALAPALIEGLAASGLLEELVRRRLRPFYQSQAFAQVLAAAGID